jgi:predicted HicB family RNase H-like nuclease
MAASPQIVVRLNPALKAALEKLAKADKHSLSSLVQKVLEEFVDAQKKK